MKTLYKQTWVKILCSLIIVFVLAFGLTGTVNAMEYINSGVIRANDIIDDDAFVTGQNVVVDGTVNGILFASGSEVLINGTINGDAFLTGQTVTVSKTAQINGNLFFGGQIINLDGKVSGSAFGGAMATSMSPTAYIGRNLFYGGYSLEAKNGSAVTKDLSIGAYQLVMAGSVGRDVSASVAALQLDGKIGRNLKAEVESPSTNSVSMNNFFQQPGVPQAIRPGLHVADNASIGGKLTYTSPVDQKSAILSVPSGGVVFQTPVPNKPEQKQVRSVLPAPITWGFDRIRSLITLLIFGALALWLLPALFTETVELARNKPLPAAGIGILTVIVGYLGSFLAFLVILSLGLFLSVITLGGLTTAVFGVGFTGLGLVFSVFVVLVSDISKVLVAFLAGRWIVEKLSPQYHGSPFLPLFVGVLVYVILTAIPFIGWIFSFAATIIGMGALWMLFRNHTKRSEPVMVTVPPTA